MIKIDSIGNTTQTQRTSAKKRKEKVGNSGFSSLLSSVDSSTGVQETSSVGNVQNVSMLSLQEISDDDVRERKAYKRAHVTLDALEEVRDALLMGALPYTSLEQLESLVKEERERTDNPDLNAILDEIEVRAAVEMAKLEKARERR